jgi:non-specific serine/threonine protein kinase
MRALIDWSYDLLSPREQTLLLRLGIFAGGCTLQAVEAVCAGGGLNIHAIFDLLSSLVEKSLVVANPSETEARYRLLETTREYALEKLAASGERAPIAQKHAEWFASFFARVDDALWTTPAVRWLPSVKAELDNARAALSWALTMDVTLAAQIAGRLQECWLLSGLVGEGRRWIEASLARLEPGTEPALEARLWWALAALSVAKPSADAARRAILLFEAVGDRLGAACGHASLAAGYMQMSQLADAEAAINCGLAISRELGITQSMLYALALAGRARIIRNLGRSDEARTLLREASELCAAYGDDLRGAIPRIALAELEFTAGNARRAVALPMPRQCTAAGTTTQCARPRRLTAPLRFG